MRANLAILLFCGSVWGVAFTLTRVVMSGGGHPLAVTFWHAAASAALIWAGLALTGRLPRIDRAFLRFAPVLGVLGGAAPSFLLFWAAQHVGAGVLSVCMATVPLMQIGLSAALGIEPFRARRLFGLLLGLAAVWLIADPERGAAPAVWVLVATLGAFCYACEDSFIALRRPPGLSSLHALAGMTFFAALYAAPTLLFVDPAPLSLAAPGAPELAFALMVPGSLAAYGLFVHLIGRAGPVFASQVAYVVTVTGVIAGAAILDEAWPPVFWIALALIVVGLALGLPRPGLRDRTAPGS